jgi:hypothetical protein
MGRFDEKPFGDNPDKRNVLPLGRIVFGTIALMMLFVFVVVILSGSEVDPVCNEITTLMLDDPEHTRFHNDYPNVMMELHTYLDENCADMPMMETKGGSVSVGSGGDMP